MCVVHNSPVKLELKSLLIQVKVFSLSLIIVSSTIYDVT